MVLRSRDRLLGFPVGALLHNLAADSTAGLQTCLVGPRNQLHYGPEDEATARRKYDLAADTVLHADEDVLETWFSSALWPFATLGWPAETPELERFASLEQGIEGADVIMSLRLQKERMIAADIPDEQTYFDGFGLTSENLKLAKPDAIVMHPGPVNRGIELSSEVADGSQSVILQQVTNGIAVRMAVMEILAGAF